MKQDVYQSITDRIVTAIEEGKTAPWQKPWRSSGGMPISLSTGRPYRGINVLLLALSGYDDPRWGTYKAIGDVGGQVRKGEKATQVVLWKTVPRNPGPGDEDPGSYWFMRFFNVFNARQADGLPELEREEERAFTPIQLAEEIVREYVFEPGSANPGPPVMYGYDRAAYSPSLDHVVMPEPQQFVSDESFYTTLFHELVHSTGHEKRLARIEPALFGTDPYAKEELVAEIGASFLAGMAGFEDAGGDQSAAYVAGWLRPLSGDPKFVVQAAAQAQKAADAILQDSFAQAQASQASQAGALAAVPS